MSNRPLEAKTCVITGANTGIGRVTAERLAALGMRMVLAGRSEARTAPVLDAIQRTTGERPVFVRLDLGDLSSVRAAAAQILQLDTPIRLLINNAGIVGTRSVSVDGFESMFAVNHLGHFLLTQLLMERIRQAESARIINVASRAHYRARGIDWGRLERPAGPLWGIVHAYAVSKLCNVLFTRGLQARLQGTGVSTVSLHPGVVATDLWRSFPRPLATAMGWTMIDAEAGAQTSLFCATQPSAAIEDGAYYHQCKPKRPSDAALDDALADELWHRSEAWAERG